MTQRNGGGKGNGGNDDGLVTSAPASKVGSLLTDLLSEAKAEVAAERQALEAQVEEKQSAEAAERERDEAKRREELQRQLIEETRRRNEALTRKEREEKARREQAAQEAREAELRERAAEEAAKAGVAVQAPAKQRSPWVWVAALALVLLAGGTTAGLALSQPPGMTVPTLSGVADNAITKAKLQLARASLDAKAKEAEKLRNDARIALKNAKTAEEKAIAEKAMRKAVEAEKKATEDAIKRMGLDKKPTTRKRPKKPGLKIRTDYFSD